MDKETMSNICEIIKIITPLIILILSISGFTNINSQITNVNTDLNNMNGDINDLETMQLSNMDDDQVEEFKGHLDEDEARDLEKRLRIYLSD